MGRKFLTLRSAQYTWLLIRSAFIPEREDWFLRLSQGDGAEDFEYHDPNRLSWDHETCQERR